MCKAWTAADVYSMDSCRYTLSSLPKAVSQLSMTRIRVPVCLLQGTESGPVSGGGGPRPHLLHSSQCLSRALLCSNRWWQPHKPNPDFLLCCGCTR
jgi:hypothetical protein